MDEAQRLDATLTKAQAQSIARETVLRCAPLWRHLDADDAGDVALEVARAVRLALAPYERSGERA